MTVGEIYEEIDKFSPFDKQESWDNSGILTGDRKTEVKSIMLCLDITKAVALEAVKKKADLVIAHHPVIFSPLKCLDGENPAVILAAHGIASICMHTSFDLADGGLNDLLVNKLELRSLKGITIDNQTGLGRVAVLNEPCSVKELSKRVKDMLGCSFVRFNLPEKIVKRVGIISGSGSGYFKEAYQVGCDALITGDVKHSAFIDAENTGFAIIDAGHYYTENIITEFLLEKLKGFSENIFIAENNRDITMTI